MKIGTFNLRDLFDEGTYIFHFHADQFIYTADFIQKRIDVLSNTIRKMDPDIIFLQEVASEKVLTRIVAQIKSQYSIFVSKPDHRGIANAVLYRLKNCSCSSISAAGELPVFIEGDEDLYGQRISSNPRREFIYLKTIYRDLPLNLIGVHLKASVGVAKKDKNDQFLNVVTQMDAADGLIRSTLVKLSQARKLREVIDSLFAKENNDAQIIVLGDFNAQDDTDVMRIIKGELSELPATLSNACDVIPERNRFSHIKRGRKRLIDHILVSKKIKQSVGSVKIINKKLRDQTMDKAAPLIVESDHAPIIMELA